MISGANFIPGKFGISLQAFWKIVLHTRLNVYREKERKRERERERERERAHDILGL